MTPMSDGDLWSAPDGVVQSPSASAPASAGTKRTMPSDVPAWQGSLTLVLDSYLFEVKPCASGFRLLVLDHMKGGIVDRRNSFVTADAAMEAVATWVKPEGKKAKS